MAREYDAVKCRECKNSVEIKRCKNPQIGIEGADTNFCSRGVGEESGGKVWCSDCEYYSKELTCKYDYIFGSLSKDDFCSHGDWKD